MVAATNPTPANTTTDTSTSEKGRDDHHDQDDDQDRDRHDGDAPSDEPNTGDRHRPIAAESVTGRIRVTLTSGRDNPVWVTVNAANGDDLSAMLDVVCVPR